MEKTLMTRAIAFAREIKELTDCTPCDLRDVVPVLMPCLTGDGESDFTINLGGHDWRFIRMDDADDILTKELESDPYILGCFNASFIASCSDLSIEIVEALQEGEKYEALGQHLIDTGCVSEMAEEYARYDGFGHHFAHYDGETHELQTEGYYAFNQG